MRGFEKDYIEKTCEQQPVRPSKWFEWFSFFSLKKPLTKYRFWIWDLNRWKDNIFFSYVLFFIGEDFDEPPLNSYSKTLLCLMQLLVRLLLKYKIGIAFVSLKILCCLKHCFVSNIFIGGVKKKVNNCFCF